MSSCEPCLDGTYKPTAGPSMCLACPAGRSSFIVLFIDYESLKLDCQEGVHCHVHVV